MIQKIISVSFLFLAACGPWPGIHGVVDDGTYTVGYDTHHFDTSAFQRALIGGKGISSRLTYEGKTFSLTSGAPSEYPEEWDAETWEGPLPEGIRWNVMRDSFAAKQFQRRFQDDREYILSSLNSLAQDG